MPNLAFPRGLPRPRGRRHGMPVDAVSAVDIAAPDIIEAAAIRWIHIESPRTADRDSLEEHFYFHPLDYEDVLLAQQPTEVRINTRTTTSSSSSISDVAEGDGDLTAELDRFMGPTFLITLPNIPLPPLGAMFDERYRSSSTCARRPSPRAPATCYKIVDACVSTRRSRCSARWPSSSIAWRTTSSRAGHRRSSRHLGGEAGDHRLPADDLRPQRAVLATWSARSSDSFQEELRSTSTTSSDAAERIWDTLENYEEVDRGAGNPQNERVCLTGSTTRSGS